jgi:hypothetical protein
MHLKERSLLISALGWNSRCCSFGKILKLAGFPFGDDLSGDVADDFPIW